MSDTTPELPRGKFLAGKLGPLPVWAWGAILGVGVLGFYLLRQRASGSTTATSSTDGSALDAIGYNTAGLNSSNSSTDTTSTGSASGSATDNQTWLNTAITGVANQTSGSASAISAVLNRYLYSGGSFNAQEQKWIDTAINLYGAPPQGTGGDSTFTGKASGSTSSGGATGSSAQNPYTFFQKGGTMYITNVNTGKSAGIKSGADYSVLRAYVQSINTHKPFNSGSTDVSYYVGKIS